MYCVVSLTSGRVSSRWSAWPCRPVPGPGWKVGGSACVRSREWWGRHDERTCWGRRRGWGWAWSWCSPARGRPSTAAQEHCSLWRGPPHSWWRTGPSTSRSSPWWCTESWPPWSRCACGGCVGELRCPRSPLLRPAAACWSVERVPAPWCRCAGTPAPSGSAVRRRPRPSRSAHMACSP